MKIYANVKAAGSRRNVFDRISYETDISACSAGDIIRFFVASEVEKFNSGSEGPEMLGYLSEKDIDDQAATGKIAFGRLLNNKQADSVKAAENALECFRDGLVRVFLNDEELTSEDQQITLSEGDVFTFIRLTFLSGRMW